MTATEISEQSWMELLLDLKERGLKEDPKLTVGDGALGCWKAMRKVYNETRHQCCWVHKTANIINKMPKNLQEKAKQKLHEVWMAETRKDANKAFDAFVSAYEDKYPKAVDCLKKIMMSYCLSMIFQQLIGSIFEPRTLLSRLLQRYDSEQQKPKDVSLAEYS